MENNKWVITRVISPLDDTDEERMYYAGMQGDYLPSRFGPPEILWVKLEDFKIKLYDSCEELPKRITMSYNKGEMEQQGRLYVNEAGVVCGIAEKIPVMKIKRNRKYILSFDLLDYSSCNAQSRTMYLDSGARSIVSGYEDYNTWNVNREAATIFNEEDLPKTLTILDYRMTLKTHIKNVEGMDVNILTYESDKSAPQAYSSPIRVALLEVFD